MEARLGGVAVLCIIMTITAAVSGCGYSPLTSRNDNPIIIDKLNSASWFYAADLRTVATKADRRLALVRVGVSPGMDTVRMPVGFICAEPPPDIAESTAQLIALAASAGDGKRQLGVGYSKEDIADVALLLRRSQGIQFARDAFFQMCLARMNGVIADEEWTLLFSAVSDVSKAMVLEEIKSDSLLNQMTEFHRSEITGKGVEVIDLGRRK